MARRKLIFSQREGLFYWLRIYEKDLRLIFEVKHVNYKIGMSMTHFEVKRLHSVLGEWIRRIEELANG